MDTTIMPGGLPKKPASRQDFKIAIICALTLEADMVEMILDKDWADDNIRYGKAPGDTNAYTAGVIAQHNIILACCSTIGGNNAAQVATSLRMSFTGVKIAFVVGICGVSPYTTEHEEIVLGDCIISTAVVQFDLGRRGPEGFKMKDGLNGLGRVGREVGSSLAMLMTRKSRLRLSRNLNSHLETLKEQDPERVKYPGCEEDRLFDASYTHCHRLADGSCTTDKMCTTCDAVTGICGKSCAALQCANDHIISRNRLTSNSKPAIHFGHFGSSNTVLKSGLERDEIADTHKVIAFEMEGSGVWDVCPTVVVKAACDYADSHKNKKWQPYAAAVAASTLKSLLQELELADEESLPKDLDIHSAPRNNAKPPSYDDVVAASNPNPGFQLSVLNVHNYPPNVSQKAGTNSKAVEELVQKADAAICVYYSSSNNLKIVRLSGEELGLDKCYINLALVDLTSRKQTRETFSLRDRLKLETCDIGEPVTLEALFEQRKTPNGTTISPRRIFIQGRAGVGKTTLCKKLVYEFLQGRLGQKLFDRLVWIPLRRLKYNKDKDYNWRELLQDAYPIQDPTWKKNREAYSDLFYNSTFLSRTLLLFDGLDEVTREWTEGGNMQEFLGSIICDSPNVVVTSRPHTKALSIGQFDLELETVGFLGDQIDAYLKNCAAPEAIPRMKLFMAVRPVIRGLLRIPIQLDAFCCTWRQEDDYQLDSMGVSATQSSDGEHTSTMTQLYCSISLELCRKDIVRSMALRRARKTEDYRFSQLSEEMLKSLGDFELKQYLENELRFLGELAFQGMISNTVNFSPKYQDQIVSYLSKARSRRLQIPTPYNTVLEALSFLRSSDLERDASKRNYHFLHLTFQEFFAAQHFAEHWLENIPLWLLLPGKPQELSPLKFLQKEKYNPRYNIFWRFVTGLIQMQSDDSTIDRIDGQEDIVTFFDQLHSKPVDLLGSTHRRLIMYCLSEVIPSETHEIRELRRREEELLLRETIREYESNQWFKLGRETEFPESVLHSLIQDSKNLPHKVILKALEVLESRPFVSTKVLQSVSQFITDKFAIELQAQAIITIFKHSETESQETIAATQICKTLLSNMDSEFLSIISYSLGRATLLPWEIVAILVTMLSDQDREIRYLAVGALNKQSSLPREAIAALITILWNGGEISLSRSKAADVLSRQSSLPQEAIATLVPLLEDNEWRVRSLVAHALSRQSSLPLEATAALDAALNRKNIKDRVQPSTMNTPVKESSVSQKSIDDLIAMLKHEKRQTRSSAAAALSKQPSLPQEAITALIALLHDQGQRVYPILDRHNSFYTAIKHLQDETWQQLWVFWFERGSFNEISCYELEGTLNVWFNGVMHQISHDPMRTREMLQVVLGKEIQWSAVEPVADPTITARNLSVTQ